MTIVVTVKVSDGVVLASDSAGSFFITDPRHPDKIYNNAIKVFNLVKVWPIGALDIGKWWHRRRVSSDSFQRLEAESHTTARLEYTRRGYGAASATRGLLPRLGVLYD